MMTKTEWNTYWAEIEEKAERDDPGGFKQRREQLHEESRTIHKTIMLHFDGIDSLTKRQNEIDAEIAAIDNEMEVA
jgi:hypothetical protein